MHRTRQLDSDPGFRCQKLPSHDFLTAPAQERAGTVRAAERLHQAGLPCPVVSVGSTPTALSAQTLDGVTEVRAGVYVFFDLVMLNVGVCTMDEITLSVLTTVIGHQEENGSAIVDPGWIAMSRDQGTQKQKRDFGYGQVCAEGGTPIDGYIVESANQEHGIVCRATASITVSSNTFLWVRGCGSCRIMPALRRRSSRDTAPS